MVIKGKPLFMGISYEAHLKVLQKREEDSPKTNKKL